MPPKMVLIVLCAILGIQLHYGGSSHVVTLLGIAAISFGVDYLCRHIPLLFVGATWLIGFIINWLSGFPQAGWWLWLSDFWTGILVFFLLPYLMLIIPALLISFVIGGAGGSGGSTVYRDGYRDDLARAQGNWANNAR